MKHHAALVAVLAIVFAGTAELSAQAAGARGGIDTDAQQGSGEPSEHAVERYIAIEGLAEVRVQPTSIRAVLAVTSEAATAKECHADNQGKLDALINALVGLDMDRKSIVVDFISMLPMYEWEIQTQEERKVAVEKSVGFRLQNNVHLSVPTEQQTRAAVAEAFKLGITDVLAFDYWNGELDQHKVAAQRKALAEAQRKAELLLSALFKEKPLPINVHEATWVIYPKDMYRSFENAYAGQYQSQHWRNNTPSISAFRPKNTYYHGFYERADVQDSTMPMHPQISIVAKIKLYYASPGRPKDDKDKAEKE